MTLFSDARRHRDQQKIKGGNHEFSRIAIFGVLTGSKGSQAGL